MGGEGGHANKNEKEKGDAVNCPFKNLSLNKPASDVCDADAQTRRKDGVTRKIPLLVSEVSWQRVSKVLWG